MTVPSASDTWANDLLAQRALLRTNVNDICRTLDANGVRGVPIDDAIIEGLQKVVAKLLKLEDNRLCATGAKLGISLLKYNLERQAFADRCARLDAGQNPETNTTELRVAVIVPDRRG